MVYTIEKIQDKYYLLNEDATTLDYDLQKLSNCVDYSTTVSGTLDTDEQVEFAFDGDGEYQLVLTDGVDTDTIPIKYYLELQASMIDSLYYTLCGCSCGCDECDEVDTCKKYCNLLMTRAKVDVYKRLTNPQGVAFFDGIYKETACMITKPLYCSVAEETIVGEATCNDDIIKKLLALDYLAMYFFEYLQVESDEDKAFIKSKFKTEKLFCCVQDLGIDVGNIETLINNNMGTFTIESAAYVNQPPSQVGDYTLGVTNRAVTILTLAMFTSSTTPVYVDPEGDPADAVRIDTLPADGVLYLNAVAVTPGQIIDVADINSNLLTYESPDQDAFDSDTFEFSVRDSGSGLFSS